MTDMHPRVKTIQDPSAPMQERAALLCEGLAEEMGTMDQLVAYNRLCDAARLIRELRPAEVSCGPATLMIGNVSTVIPGTGGVYRREFTAEDIEAMTGSDGICRIPPG